MAISAAKLISCGHLGFEHKAHDHGSTTRELLRAADEALYAAKQAGRDRVVIYEMRN